VPGDYSTTRKEGGDLYLSYMLNEGEWFSVIGCEMNYINVEYADKHLIPSEARGNLAEEERLYATAEHPVVILNTNSELVIPHLRVYKPHFFDKNLPSKIGMRLVHGILKTRSSEKKPLSYRRLGP
jgi:hypothetical protein